MKKILGILLALTLVFALAACAAGSTAPSASPSPSVSAQPSEAASPSEAAAPSAEETPADDDWSYIKEKGELVIGITLYAPISFNDENGKLIGFDTEFAEAVCAKLGLTPKFVEINWDTKEVELKSKNIDCIWNGLTVTEERKENMAFTDNYLKNRQVVVINTANADKYTDIDSFAGVSVVAEKGSAGEGAVADYLKDAAYTAVDSQASALLEVKAGTAEAAVLDYTMASYLTGPGTDYDDLQIVTTIALSDDEFYAIGFRLDSTAVAKINEQITALQNDGTLKSIADKYNLADLLVKK